MWVAHGTGAFTGAVLMSRLRQGAGRELPFIGAGMVLAGAGFLLYFGVATYAAGLIGSAIGGLGFAFPAGTCNLIKPSIFFAISSS